MELEGKIIGAVHAARPCCPLCREWKRPLASAGADRSEKFNMP